jgi:hypothetical protein
MPTTAGTSNSRAATTAGNQQQSERQQQLGAGNSTDARNSRECFLEIGRGHGHLAALKITFGSLRSES